MPQIGDKAKIEAQFTDETGPADPSTVTLRIRQPDGTELTPIPVHAGLGLFRHYQLLDQAGTWLWRFLGEGAVAAAIEGEIDVERSLFEPELGSGVRDYVTRRAFRAWAHDDGPEPRFDDSDIDDAQAECIDRLEDWARSSWSNVTGVDGDGTAAAYRTYTERQRVDWKLILMRRPVFEIVSFTAVSTGTPSDVPVGSYQLNARAGILTFIGSPGSGVILNGDGSVITGWGPGPMTEYALEYTFGWGACPRAVKVPLMKAMRARLEEEVRDAKGKSTRVPSNTRTLTSSRATLDFEPRNTDEALDLPWPWHEDASREIRAYWGARRPRRIMSVVGG